MGHGHIEVVDGYTLDDEAVADADAKDVWGESSEETVVVAGAEPEPTAVTVEGETGHEDDPDLVVTDSRSIGGGLPIAESMLLVRPSSVVDREVTTLGRRPGQGQISLRPIVEEGTKVDFARHGIEGHDPAAITTEGRCRRRMIEEPSEPDAHSVVGDGQ